MQAQQGAVTTPQKGSKKMKKLVIKDWMWQKIAREHNAPRMWGGDVDAVIDETEKAYKVMMGAVNYTVFTWVPKSQCEWVEAEHEGVETIVCSYEEALERRAYLRCCYC